MHTHDFISSEKLVPKLLRTVYLALKWLAMMIASFWITENRGDTFTCRYILATSIVKDLVVLLDTGQRDVAFDSSKNIITEFSRTISVSDCMNVVTFNSMDATLLQQTQIKMKAYPILLCFGNCTSRLFFVKQNAAPRPLLNTRSQQQQQQPMPIHSKRGMLKGAL